jgi:hypothetical protein
MNPNRFSRHVLVALATLATSITIGTQAASPSETFKGTLASGGGVDDLFVEIRCADGKRVHVMCDQRCGNWFEETGEAEVQRLKPAYQGKRVVVTVRNERNNGRIAGPGDEDQLLFVKSIRIVK